MIKKKTTKKSTTVKNNIDKNKNDGVNVINIIEPVKKQLSFFDSDEFDGERYYDGAHNMKTPIHDPLRALDKTMDAFTKKRLNFNLTYDKNRSSLYDTLIKQISSEFMIYMGKEQFREPCSFDVCSELQKLVLKPTYNVTFVGDDWEMCRLELLQKRLMDYFEYFEFCDIKSQDDGFVYIYITY